MWLAHSKPWQQNTERSWRHTNSGLPVNQPKYYSQLTAKKFLPRGTIFPTSLPLSLTKMECSFLMPVPSSASSSRAQDPSWLLTAEMTQVTSHSRLLNAMPFKGVVLLSFGPPHLRPSVRLRLLLHPLAWRRTASRLRLAFQLPRIDDLNPNSVSTERCRASISSVRQGSTIQQ